MTILYLINGPEKGTSYNVESETITVGRSPENEIQIKDQSISRRHLKIQKSSSAGKFIIEDLKSTNGTFIDGRPIPPGTGVEVKGGMVIAIGNVYFSLDRAYSGDVLGIKNSIDIVNELGETGIFDRPMTSPKNLEVIYKVSNVLMQSLNISETLEKILDYIFELLVRIDRGVVILLDPASNQIVDVITRSPKPSGGKGTTMYSRSIVNRVVREGKAIIMSDTFDQDSADRSESMELMKIRSVMCVPLISRSQIRGVLYVDSVNRPYGFRTEDLSLLTTLATPAAIAIENGMLYSDSEKIIRERTKSLKETERKLRESEARFKAIFNNMSSGVMVYEVVDKGQDFKILDMNRAGLRLENSRRKDLVGQRASEVFPALKDAGVLEDFKTVWTTGKPVRRSFTVRMEDRVVTWRDYYIYRLPSGEVVSIFDDITDKKKAEEEQKALQKQLLVSQKMESIGAFAGGTAHNFRNILQAISGNVEYLELTRGDDGEIQELSRSIYDSVEKGVDLINGLLHFSKRGGDYNRVNLDLHDVIMKTHDIMEKVLKKNIEIDVNVEKGLFVEGNHSLLSQVFMNLFTNARDAMPDGGRLGIEGRKEDKKVVALVTDTGHGMDRETLDKIFDPFFTLKDVGLGTGLGLSTSLGIVEQHKGAISVSSKPGNGTRFKITLPLADMQGAEASRPGRQLIFGKGEKILIVDDEPSVLETLVQLTERLGYQVVSTSKPSEVAHLYKTFVPDVVLMDRSMPGMDGIACAKKIVKGDPKARIIIVSGYEESGPEGISGDVKALIKGYLIKPCGLEELSHMINRVICGQQSK